MVKIAYLITAHKNPASVSRLINSLSGANVAFFVHIDKKANISAFHNIIMSQVNTDQITWIPSIRTERLYWNVVKSVINLLRRAYQSVENYDYFIWLSGQDYPLRPNQEIQSYLQARNGVSFVKSVPLPKLDWNENGYDRVARHYFYFIKNRWIFPMPETSRRRKLYNLLLSLWLPYPRVCPAGVTLRGGSAWFCLHRSAVSALFRFMKQRPDIVRYFQTIKNPDEMFLQSILPDLLPQDQLQKRSLTFVSWGNLSGGHPDTLTKDDFDRMISADALFARKFDPEIDETILEMLDDYRNNT